MGTLEPWQERVVQEKFDLDEKKYKLKEFLRNPEFIKKISEENLLLLTEQYGIMKEYSRILGERIELFSK